MPFKRFGVIFATENCITAP